MNAPSDSSSSAPPPQRSFGWPHAVAAIAAMILIGVLATGYLTARTAERTVAGALDRGADVAAGLRDMAQAFRSGTVTTSFRSFATEVRGQTYLQFSTLEQMEQFERSEAASILWGQLALPDVVVQATAPVQYTYYLDFNEEWLFQLEGRELEVVAPVIRFNRPSIDPSRLEWDVKEGSLFRDEEPVREALRAGLTTMAEARARDNIPLVREIGRRQTETFVTNWLLRTFGDQAEDLEVKLVFRDEASRFPDLGVPNREGTPSALSGSAERPVPEDNP